MSTFRLMLLGTAAVGLTAAAMSTASAGEVEKSFGVSGHVNRAMVMGDDGKDDFLVHVDPTAISGSRLRGVASAKSESLSTGATIEMGTQSGGGSSQHSTTGTSINLRHSYLWVSNSMGRIRMGHTGHASNGSAGNDLSSTGNAGSFGGTTFAGILTNNTTVATPSAAGASIGSMLTDHTNGRAVGISYDTPNFNGFAASISHMDSGSGAAQVSYSADYDGLKIAAAIGGNNVAGDAVDTRYNGSLAVSMANGLNALVAYGTTDTCSSACSGATNVEDGKSWYGKLGYKMNASDMGTTGLALFYRNNEDIDTTAGNADEMKSWGLLAEQSLSDYGTTVYGSYEHYEYDTNVANFSDVDGIMVGVKVVF